MDHATVDLLGMELAQMDRWQLLEHMFEELEHERGGWVITANLDFLRRYALDTEIRALYAKADLRVADGMPLVWAATVQGDRLPERVPGSSLVWLLAEKAAKEGRSIYLLGGDPGAGEGAEEKFLERYPNLKIAGRSNPWVKSPPTPQEVEELVAELRRNVPDILLVGLGSPKQEHVIEALTPHFPATWMIGVGISFSFVAGHIERAPRVLRKVGLEWLHRLAQEPKRLGRRYLIEDLPFAVELFAHAVAKRGRRKALRPERRGPA